MTGLLLRPDRWAYRGPMLGATGPFTLESETTGRLTSYPSLDAQRVRWERRLHPPGDISGPDLCRAALPHRVPVGLQADDGTGRPRHASYQPAGVR